MDADSQRLSQLVEFRDIQLVRDDAEVLKAIEGEIHWELRPQPYDDDSQGFAVDNHRVVALSISTHREPSFVGQISKLDGLQKLHLNNSSIEILPSSFGNLENLRELTVDAALESIPDIFEHLQSLERLVLAWNKLTLLPESIAALSQLRELDLDHNSLTQLPESFGELRALEALNLGDNQLSSLCDAFGGLTSLRTLNLANNRLSQLPPTFGELTDLEELKLWENRLTSLPDSFGNLKSLKDLDLSRNRLAVLPKSLVNLKSLAKLEIGDNRLEALPVDFGNLRRLEHLGLGHNRLMHLPETFWNLPELQHLSLCDNRLCEISEKVGTMSSLRYLNLSGNNMIALPEAIETLYSRGFSPVSCPSTAKSIPPKLLFSKHRQLRTDIRYCFVDSLGILENVEDFVEEWLSGNERIYPYLLKLGSKLRPAMHRIRDGHPERKDELWTLSEELDKRAKRSKVAIQFINFVEYDGSISYPMGLLYISSCLKKDGFPNVGYVDHTCMIRELAKDKLGRLDQEYPSDSHERSIRSLLSCLDERNPNIILMGPITTKFLVELVHLVPLLREHHPRAILLAGGPHFRKESQLNVELLRDHCKDLDGILVGEAEETVVEIAEQFYSVYDQSGLAPLPTEFQEDLGRIPGVLTRDGHFQPREPPDLEDMPFPDMDLLEEYWRNPKALIAYEYSLSNRRNPLVGVYEGIFQGESDSGAFFEDIRYFDRPMDTFSRFRFGVVVGSRGCPYECAFCCSPGPRRVHSARHIFDQMVELNERFGIRLFSFFDPLFTTTSQLEKGRIEELSDMLLDANLDFRFIVEIRADIVLGLSGELLEKIVRSGCVQFNLGIEKGSDESLKKMTKKTKIQDHFDAVARLRKAASRANRPILVNGTLILGGPGEKRADIRESFIHGFSLDLDEVDFYPLEIHPDTAVYQCALGEGILEPGVAPHLDTAKYPLYATEDLPRSYFDEICESWDRTLRSWRVLKNTIRRIEQQIRYGDDRYFLRPEDHALGHSYRHVRKFIEEAMHYLRDNPSESLTTDGKVPPSLKAYAEEVEKEFGDLEGKLSSQHPEHESEFGDYYMGSLAREWQSFLGQLNSLLSPERYQCTETCTR